MFYKEEIVDGVTGVMAPTLAALDKLADVSRYLHPTALASLIGRIADTDQPVREGFARFCALDLPEELQPFRRQVEVVVDNVCKTRVMMWIFKRNFPAKSRHVMTLV